jgi:hypothetical protein
MGQPQWAQSGHSRLDCGHVDHVVWLQYRGWHGHRHYQKCRVDQGQNDRIQGGNQMKGFIIGTIFGIVICTVGLTGIARMLDYGVVKVQEISREAAK